MKCASSDLTAGSSVLRRAMSFAMRNAERARAPESCSMSYRLFLVRRRSRVHRHRELRDVSRSSFECSNFADALLLHLVNAQDGMHGQIGPFAPVEFALDAFLGRVHDHGGTLAEN